MDEIKRSFFLKKKIWKKRRNVCRKNLEGAEAVSGSFCVKQVQIRNKKIGFKMKHSIYKMYNPISDNLNDNQYRKFMRYTKIGHRTLEFLFEIFALISCKQGYLELESSKSYIFLNFSTLFHMLNFLVHKVKE